MNEIFIVVETSAHCDLRAVVVQAIDLARRLGISIALPFNGITLQIKENSDPDQIETGYLADARSRHALERQ